MTTPANTETIRSGARHVDETSHLAAGLTEPRDVSISESQPEERTGEPQIETLVGHMTLSMFTQGASTRVRVGNAHNASELYEHAFDTVEDANTAMLDAGILTPNQVPDPSQLAGTNIALPAVTVQQLESAGLKRHGASTL